MSNNQVPQNQICFNRNINKTALINKTDKSSSNAQLNRFSTYIRSKRNSYTIIEGQVDTFFMTASTPNSAEFRFTYIGNPIYVIMVITNIQQLSDTQTIQITSSPYTIYNLTPNSYYTVDTYTVFRSGSKFLKTYKNALSTLNEGPPRNVYINNVQPDSATLYFTASIGKPTSYNLIVTDRNDTTNILNFTNILSPYEIMNLIPVHTYDISLTSYYGDTQNSYSYLENVYFTTLFENYTEITGITNITNHEATITYKYTGNPIQNTVTVTDAQGLNQIYTIDSLSDSVTFNNLSYGVIYNISIVTTYGITNNSYTVILEDAFQTLNEEVIGGVNNLNVTGDNITFKFLSSPGDNVFQYIVTLYNTQIGYNTEYIYTNVPNVVSYDQLQYNTGYTLTIQTIYDGNNTYTYTHPSVITTLNESRIVNISYINLKNTSVDILFNTSPGISPIYNVEYKGTRINTTSYYINGLTNNYFSLSNLAINVPYNVKITTIYPETNNTYSYTALNLFTTLDQGLTQVYAIKNITQSAFDITYINTYYGVSSYLFTIKMGSNIITTKTTYGISNNTKTVNITGLTSGQTYNITILTTYSDGNTYLTTYANTVTTL